ncbi:biotin--[acetyl-CoA-carboxylase] ligase [Paracoccaceae bacterium]|nr:biotin--[acetyl-CoA-carboxylase] ligase [Paracoccaceae bacterium]
MNHFLDSDIIWLDSVDSTNEEIKRRIPEFNKPTWIIANKQSKGKGRNGNTWFSNYGNFSGSIIFFPTVEYTYFHLFGFLVGVALYNTTKEIVANGVDIRLKWPNDLMIENCKVAGILLESVQKTACSKSGLIVGIGVNLNSSPSLESNSKKRYNTESLASFTNEKINRSIFFSEFNDQLVKLGTNIPEEELCSVLKLWQDRSYDKGSKIQITDNKGKINSGTFLGLDEIGGLILGDNTGFKKIYSGDVYFGS